MFVTIAPKRRREKSARIARCTAANARVKIGRCPVRKSHNFQLKPGYRANYACTYCGVDMIGDSRADNPCKNAELYVINQELNEPPLTTSVPRKRVLEYAILDLYTGGSNGISGTPQSP